MHENKSQEYTHVDPFHEAIYTLILRSVVFVYQNAITIVFHSTFTLPVAPRNCVCSS